MLQLSKKHKFYREWMMECGWGIMMGFDSVEANSFDEARNMKAHSMYCNSFERILKIDPKHHNLDDDALEKIYGQ